MKKFIALVLSMVLVFSVAVVATADIRNPITGEGSSNGTADWLVIVSDVSNTKISHVTIKTSAPCGTITFYNNKGVSFEVLEKITTVSLPPSTELKFTVTSDNMASYYVVTSCVKDVFVETVLPKCTTKGYDLYKCNKCNKTEEKNIKNPLGHEYHNDECDINDCEDWVIVTEPTEEKEGLATHECTRVGCTVPKEKVLPMLPHTCNDTRITEYPTCEESGCEYDVCAKESCEVQKYYKVLEPLGHKLGESPVLVVLPALNEEGTEYVDGYARYECVRYDGEVCKHFVNVPIPYVPDTTDEGDDTDEGNTNNTNTNNGNNTIRAGVETDRTPARTPAAAVEEEAEEIFELEEIEVPLAAIEEADEYFDLDEAEVPLAALEEEEDELVELDEVPVPLDGMPQLGEFNASLYLIIGFILAAFTALTASLYIRRIVKAKN